jgi:hypothetical protein
VIEPRILAEGARVMHVGFRKSGTTAIQDSFVRAKEALAAAGTVCLGIRGNQHSAALAVTGQMRGSAALGAKQQPIEKWNQLVATVAALGTHRRAMLSSEFFDAADDGTVRKIVHELGGDEPEIVFTVRPLYKILPSAWQQQVQSGRKLSYAHWLETVLDGDVTTKGYQSFWRRHDQAEMVSRWAEVVGPERVTLIVLDDLDRSMLYRSFETLLGAPEGTLQEEPGRTNRSLTSAETELLRQINVEILARDITWQEFHSWIYRGAAARTKQKRTPGPDEPRTVTPRWALERAGELGAGYFTRIDALGIHVVGNLKDLAAPPPMDGPETVPEPATTVPMEVAVEAVLGAAFSNRQKVSPPPPARPHRPPKREAYRNPEDLPGRTLLGLLAARVKARLRHPVANPPQRRKRPTAQAPLAAQRPEQGVPLRAGCNDFDRVRGARLR